MRYAEKEACELAWARRVRPETGSSSSSLNSRDRFDGGETCVTSTLSSDEEEEDDEEEEEEEDEEEEDDPSSLIVLMSLGIG